jgi:hypothetical protein
VQLAAPVRASRTSSRRARSVVVEANLFARAARVIQSYANQIGTCELWLGGTVRQCWYCLCGVGCVCGGLVALHVLTGRHGYAMAIRKSVVSVSAAMWLHTTPLAHLLFTLLLKMCG